MQECHTRFDQYEPPPGPRTANHPADASLSDCLCSPSRSAPLPLPKPTPAGPRTRRTMNPESETPGTSRDGTVLEMATVALSRATPGAVPAGLISIPSAPGTVMSTGPVGGTWSGRQITAVLVGLVHVHCKYSYVHTRGCKQSLGHTDRWKPTKSENVPTGSRSLVSKPSNRPPLPPPRRLLRMHVGRPSHGGLTPRLPRREQAQDAQVAIPPSHVGPGAALGMSSGHRSSVPKPRPDRSRRRW